MTQIEKQFNKLVEIAIAEKPLNQQFRCFHMAAIFKGKRLISLAANTAKTHPKAQKFGYEFCEESVHAELLSVIRARREDFSGHSLIVVRIDNQEKVNNSMPCKHCRHMLNHFDFKQVGYSNKDGRLELLK